jgi:hypothetical protein
MAKLAVALLLAPAAAFQGKALPSFARASSSATTMTMVAEETLGVQAPAGFLDPLGFVAKDGPEAFVRRRAVERKHGRIAMVAITGVLVHNAQIEFPGYLSKSADLKFSDVPDGLGGFFSIPAAGLAQIFAFCALVELAWWPANNYSGDYGCGFFGTSYDNDPETKATKLNAELANGRLAMLGIAGAMFAEGQTGETLAQQFENLSFSIV